MSDKCLSERPPPPRSVRFTVNNLVDNFIEKKRRVINDAACTHTLEIARYLGNKCSNLVGCHKLWARVINDISQTLNGKQGCNHVFMSFGVRKSPFEYVYIVSRDKRERDHTGICIDTDKPMCHADRNTYHI